MTVNFIGLIGPLGVLPHALHRTDRGAPVCARCRTLRDFLDIFNHRMISLFYRAWEKYRFPVAYERGGRRTDRFTGYLLDLIGLGTPGLAEPPGDPRPDR